MITKLSLYTVLLQVTYNYYIIAIYCFQLHVHVEVHDQGQYLSQIAVKYINRPT